ncbi:MAG: GTP cyclohydrolase FolE2, partial [Casimicrobiaceae bacterium]
MNFPDLKLIPDVQSSADSRQLAIDRVGIRGLKYPMQLVDLTGDPQSTVVEADLSVELGEHVKGTHMSRFIGLLEARQGVLTLAGFHSLLRDMVALLDARAGTIEFRFPFFVRKAAPVSGVYSLMDYQVAVSGTIRDGRIETILKIVAPVTSLCPCSKEIAEYGAHNQRSHITISVRCHEPVGITELIRIAETEASSELYGLLKRQDEKFVTERAYDNPKFVEDLVRDIAARLNDDPRIAGYRIESENFESIHNHSAYAMIRKDFD